MSEPNQLFGVPAGAWLAISAALLAASVVLSALLPRYEFSLVGPEGASVLVFDKWTGDFQRATYGPDGEPRTTSVVRPF